MGDRTMISTKALTGKLGDVRRDNNFIVTINDVSDDNQLELVVKTAFLPSVSLNVLNLQHGNDAKKFAGVATWNGGQITVIDTLSKTEVQSLLKWFKQTYNWADGGSIGFSDEYKKTGYITEYAADGRYTRKWNVEGMWISNFEPGTLDASSGDFKSVAITIELDPSRSFAPEHSDDIDTVYNDETEQDLNNDTIKNDYTIEGNQ